MTMINLPTRLEAMHHVVHDYANLVSAGTLTQAGPAARAGFRPPVNSHIQHAFLLNCRKMADFFQKVPRGDDIRAEHFLKQKETFLLPEWDKWGRAMDKQLAHLTYARVTAPKSWTGSPANRLLLEEFQAAWKIFLSKLDYPYKQKFDEEITKRQQRHPDGNGGRSYP